MYYLRSHVIQGRVNVFNLALRCFEAVVYGINSLLDLAKLYGLVFESLLQDNQLARVRERLLEEFF